ncbi:MAG: hypothetical protein NC320_01805 [Clostridium sp.]|nr:hypothetical protein [Clostridium sp.]
MKIYKRYIEEDVINGVSSIYGMANLKPNKIGQPFELWVDEIGSDRNVGHNNPRFKPKANGIQLDIMLNSNGKAEIVNADSRKIQKFKYSKEAVEFIEEFQEPLLMHWNGEIDSSDLAMIIRLVVKKKYSMDDAIEAVLNDEY